MITLWICVFLVSLAGLVKGADLLIRSAESIGLRLGISPFVIGVTIVGIGTSLPELVSSLFAAYRGVTEVVAANVIGSNVANILLIVGIAAIVGRRLIVTKNLIDVDLPLLAIATVLLLGVVADRAVTSGEAILLIATYGIYVIYTIRGGEGGEAPVPLEVTPAPGTQWKDIGLLVLGLTGLTVGATYLIDSVVALAALSSIDTGVIAITAVAIGTSLPELTVSVRAALAGKSDVALGNIFGSNIFNAFMVLGIPGLLHTLTVDTKTFEVGIPALALATLLFVISGISKKISAWEGAFYLAAYLLFLAKLFAWF